MRNLLYMYGPHLSTKLLWKWLSEAEARLRDHWTQKKRSVNSASQNNFWDEMKTTDLWYMTAYQSICDIGLLWFIAWNNYCNWHCKSHCSTAWFSMCQCSCWKNIFGVRERPCMKFHTTTCKLWFSILEKKKKNAVEAPFSREKKKKLKSYAWWWLTVHHNYETLS